MLDGERDGADASLISERKHFNVSARVYSQDEVGGIQLVLLIKSPDRCVLFSPSTVDLLLRELNRAVFRIPSEIIEELAGPPCFMVGEVLDSRWIQVDIDIMLVGEVVDISDRGITRICLVHYDAKITAAVEAIHVTAYLAGFVFRFLLLLDILRAVVPVGRRSRTTLPRFLRFVAKAIR